MTQRHIGTLLDRKAINDINDNFTELYNEYVGAGLDAAEAKEKAIQAVADSLYAKETAETTRDELTRIIREQTAGGDIVPEVVQARGTHNTVGERLNSISQDLAQKAEKNELSNVEENVTILDREVTKVKSTADEALGKAGNPLGALSVAGYKIPLEDLSTEVKDFMTGTTGITTAQGYLENNRGVTYPLLNLVRDGQLHEVQERVKNSVLSAKVIGARPDKYYCIEWLGNGFYFSAGDRVLWGIGLAEYDRVGNSFNSSSRREILLYSSDDFPEPTDIIVSRTINLPEEGLIFEVTYDRSKFEGTALNIARVNGRGFGCVIHHDNYVYRSSEEDTIIFDKKPNEFTVFVPSNNKYLGYSFRYDEKPYIPGDGTGNTKLWSFKNAAEFDRGLSLVRQFYTDATQDLMIRENGVSDYIGGAAHGDEVLQDVKIFVDDNEISPTESIKLMGSEVKMIQTTYLYRDTQHTSGTLEHVVTAKKMHRVNKDGYTLEVMLEFHEEMSLRDLFMGALTMSRKDGQNTLFNKAIIGGYLTEVDLTASETVFERLEDVKDVFIFGDGVTINWSADKKEFMEGARTWINNSSTILTKIYPSYVPVNYTTNIGEIMRQKTHYQYILS